MLRTHFKDRSKRNRIDLTMIGRFELLEPAIAHADELLTPEYAGEILNAPPLSVPPPRPYVRQEVSVWGVIVSTIKREVIAIIKI